MCNVEYMLKVVNEYCMHISRNNLKEENFLHHFLYVIYNTIFKKASKKLNRI